MIYNNILFFIAAIFLFSASSGTSSPQLPLPAALLLVSLLFVVYDRIAGRLYAKLSGQGARAYFAAEKKLSLLALACYALLIFGCDLRFYLAPLSLGGRLPALVDVTGLAFFFLFLIILWRRGQPLYEQLFSCRYQGSGFIVTNIRTNLPIIFPWLFLSLGFDLLILLPFPELTAFLRSQSGEYLSFMLFLLLVLVFFPPLVRRLWGCRPFPAGPPLDRLQKFFQQQGFSARIYLWPLFEGRVLTAAVMGIVPGFRYVLITPALLEALDPDELDAVMAHEIGHVKKRHMLLYILILGGFSLIVGAILEPFTFFILSRDSFYTFMGASGLEVENILTVMTTVLVLISMLLYFRFLFGFFIRNFERQADLNVLTATGSSEAIISAFEKIAILSGNIRDQPSWHHFGIGQRVDFLEKCTLQPVWITRHNRKVRLNFLAFVMVLGLSIFGQRLLPVESWENDYEEKYTGYMIDQKLQDEPDKARWLSMAGDLLQDKKMERKALIAYNKALLLLPEEPKLLNNLAWLLLSAENPKVRNPRRALTLALQATAQEPAGYVLDTLATAYWANGFRDRAIETELRAMEVDPAGRDYYQQQIRTFSDTEYSPSTTEEKR